MPLDTDTTNREDPSMRNAHRTRSDTMSKPISDEQRTSMVGYFGLKTTEAAIARAEELAGSMGVYLNALFFAGHSLSTSPDHYEQIMYGYRTRRSQEGA